MKGWHKESYRHYLAAKGVRTNRYYKKGFSSYNQPGSSILTRRVGNVGRTYVPKQPGRYLDEAPETPVVTIEEKRIIDRTARRKEKIQNLDDEIFKRKKQIIDTDDKKEEEKLFKEVEDLEAKKQAVEFGSGQIQVIPVSIAGRRERFPVLVTPEIAKEVVEKRPGISAVTTPQAIGVRTVKSSAKEKKIEPAEEITFKLNVAPTVLKKGVDVSEVKRDVSVPINITKGQLDKMSAAIKHDLEPKVGKRKAKEVSDKFTENVLNYQHKRKQNA